MCRNNQQVPVVPNGMAHRMVVNYADGIQGPLL